MEDGLDGAEDGLMVGTDSGMDGADGLMVGCMVSRLAQTVI